MPYIWKSVAYEHFRLAYISDALSLWLRATEMPIFVSITSTYTDSLLCIFNVK